MPLEDFVAACGFGFVASFNFCLVEVLAFELDHGTSFGVCRETSSGFGTWLPNKLRERGIKNTCRVLIQCRVVKIKLVIIKLNLYLC